MGIPQDTNSGAVGAECRPTLTRATAKAVRELGRRLHRGDDQTIGFAVRTTERVILGEIKGDPVSRLEETLQRLLEADRLRVETLTQLDVSVQRLEESYALRVLQRLVEESR